MFIVPVVLLVGTRQEANRIIGSTDRCRVGIDHASELTMLNLIKTLLLGRPTGFRSRAREKILGGTVGGGSSPDASAARAASAGTGGTAVEAAEKSLSLKLEPPRDVTPPDGYEVVLHKNALEQGRIIEIIIGGTAIAVANVGGTFYAISNTCAHAEGPLGEGTLDGVLVACPYHGWQYDVRDGKCKTNAYAAVATYPVQIVGNAVCVKL